MRKLFSFVALLMFCTLQALAGNWYVRASATGSGTGVDWTNAWTDFNSVNYTSVACGDTVWVAGGNYTHTITSTKVCTNGNTLTIQRVRATDVVPIAAAGWSSTFDSTVNQAGAVCDLEGDYFTISGRITSGWVGTTPVGGGNSCVGALTRSVTNNTLDHIKFAGPACAPAGNCSVGAYGINIVPASNTNTNFLVQYCELFDMSETFREQGWQNSVIQYNQIHDTFPDGVDHEDIIYTYPYGPSGNVIWRYNTIYNSPNDGIFFEFGGANSFIFYRNVFYGSAFSLITTKAPGTYGPILLYNNIFASTTGPCSSNCAYITDNGSTMTGVQVYNNVFYYVTNNMAGSAGELSDYNAYSYTTLNGYPWPSSSEPHSISYNPSSQNPFVNVAGGDFHLTSLSTVLAGIGKTLSIDGFENVDMDGNVAGGSWNIGAFNDPSAPPELILGNAGIAGAAVVK